MDEHEAIKEIGRARDVKTVLLGDSIMQHWGGPGRNVYTSPRDGVYESVFGDRATANFGVAGDGTQQLLWRIENGAFQNVRPDVILLMIGINNAPTHTAEEITEAIGIVIRRVRTKASSATIILLSPLPPGEGPADPVRIKMDKVTNSIERFADGEKVLFYDIRNQFLVDGGLPDNGSLSSDHIHLTRDGYGVWAEILDEILDSNGF